MQHREKYHTRNCTEKKKEEDPESTTVFCPGFQKGRVPSVNGTLAR